MTESDHIRDHLANERTFLAWVRTAVAIIVFGFAIGRFGLALRQLAAAQGEHLRSTGMSVWFGAISMFFGVALMLAGFFQFRRYQADIQAGTFRTSSSLLAIVTALIVALGITLIIYLALTEISLR